VRPLHEDQFTTILHTCRADLGSRFQSHTLINLMLSLRRAEDWNQVHELVKSFAEMQWEASTALLRSRVGRMLEGQRTLVKQCKKCHMFSCSAAVCVLLHPL
jgi:hypothetical protein